MDQLIEPPYIPEGFHLWNTPMQAWYTDLLYDGSDASNVLSLIHIYELALYAIALHRQTKWQRGKVAINIKFTDKHLYTVRLEGNFQL